MGNIERILVATDLSAPASWAETRAAMLAGVIADVLLGQVNAADSACESLIAFAAANTTVTGTSSLETIEGLSLRSRTAR